MGDSKIKMSLPDSELFVLDVLEDELIYAFSRARNIVENKGVAYIAACLFLALAYELSESDIKDLVYDINDMVKTIGGPITVVRKIERTIKI